MILSVSSPKIGMKVLTTLTENAGLSSLRAFFHAGSKKNLKKLSFYHLLGFDKYSHILQTLMNVLVDKHDLKVVHRRFEIKIFSLKSWDHKQLECQF